MEKHLTANCGMTPQYKATKRYQERHRRLGLCTSCSRKAKTGSFQCRVCIAKAKEQWRVSHPLFCAECRKLIKPEERWRGKRFHKLYAEKRQSRRYPQIHRSAAIAYQERHRKLGLCIQCPRKVFKGSLCRKHYKMAQEQSYERAAG